MTDYTDRSTEALLARRAIAEQATPGPWVNSIPVISESLTDGMKETRPGRNGTKGGCVMFRPIYPPPDARP